MTKPEKKMNALGEMGPYLSLSWQMIITIVLFVLLGYWLDQKFETKTFIDSNIIVGWCRDRFFTILFEQFYNYLRKRNNERASYCSDSVFVQCNVILFLLPTGTKKRNTAFYEDNFFVNGNKIYHKFICIVVFF